MKKHTTTQPPPNPRELADVLTAISQVADRLARKLIALSVAYGERDE